jgi:hypothetical protein
MAEQQLQPPPEALGPGTERADGAVLYGDDAAPGARAVVVPARPAAERDRDMAEARRRARCPRCADIPDGLATALSAAIRAAAHDGRVPL